MDAFRFTAPVDLTFGLGTVAGLGEQMRGLGRRVLIVTDPGVVAAGIAEQVSQILTKAGVEPVLFSDVAQNPLASSCTAAAALCAERQCDAVLGLGGGSPMDVAKMAAIMMTNPGMAPRDFEGIDKAPHDPLPLAMVPTTAGTASEVTFVAVITDVEQRFKFTVISRKLTPRFAVLDPLLTIGKPPALTAATGMDALTHAIESYTNRNINPIADALSTQAITLIGRSLRTAVVQGQDVAARTDMLLGSLLAGMAFNLTRLGLVHAMSHPLSAHYGVPHGVANALLLPPVMEFNLFGAMERTAEIGRLLGEHTSGLSQVDAARQGAAAVRRLGADVGIPRWLKDVGVQSDRIGVMAADAMKSGNILVNPRQVGLEDVEHLYASLMG
jgi:alcohol dehydrogenase class IV